MKNIHILPTKHKSKIGTHKSKTLYFHQNVFTESNFEQNFYLYITNDEKPKDGDWILSTKDNLLYKLDFKNNLINLFFTDKKIILTTDQDLIKEGVQPIDDEFLEWFVKNPNCEEVEVEKECCGQCDERLCEIRDLQREENKFNTFYKIVLLQKEPKQEPTMVDKLKEYFNNTSKEQVQKDWDESCKQVEGVISPTIDEFMKAQKQYVKQETAEEAAEKEFPLLDTQWCRTGATEEENLQLLGHRKSFVKGTKWQKEQDSKYFVKYMKSERDLQIEKMKKLGVNTNGQSFEQMVTSLIQLAQIKYSEEEVLDLLYKRDLYLFNRDEEIDLELPEEWFELNKKK
jgi:hypothetical protein